MTEIGRGLIVLGLALTVVGAALVLGGRVGLGHLPGDFTFRRGGWTVSFPLATCIVVSLILTLVLTLLRRR